MNKCKNPSVYLHVDVHTVNEHGIAVADVSYIAALYSGPLLHRINSWEHSQPVARLSGVHKVLRCHMVHNTRYFSGST